MNALQRMYSGLGEPDEILAAVNVQGWPGDVPDTNSHVHLPPNFSASMKSSF